MKVYLHTWRYGIESTLYYHGEIAFYDADSGTLVIDGTLWDHKPDVDASFREAAKTVVTGVSGGDEFSVVRCEEDCHPHDRNPDSIVLVFSAD